MQINSGRKKLPRSGLVQPAIVFYSFRGHSHGGFDAGEFYHRESSLCRGDAGALRPLS